MPALELRLTGRQIIEAAFRGQTDYDFSILGRWGDGSHGYDPARPIGYERARDALAQIERALARLGDRSGDRAKAARSWLESKRGPIAAAIAGFERICANPGDRDPKLGGTVIDDLATRIEAANAELEQAQRAFNNARRADVMKRRDDLDLARAGFNECMQELDALIAAATPAPLPDIAALKLAERQTAEIQGQDQHKPATTLEVALRQGGEAARGVVESGSAKVAGDAALVARLWICFEPRKENQYFSMRWSRYLEGGAPAPQVETESNEPAADVAAAE